MIGDKLQELLLGRPEESLQLLSLAGQRISHDLRTPLGCAMSVVDDILAGFAAGPEELTDCRTSLGKILECLNVLGGISGADTPSVERLGVDDLRELCRDVFFNGSELSIGSEASGWFCLADRCRLHAALAKILAYLEVFPPKAGKASLCCRKGASGAVIAVLCPVCIPEALLPERRRLFEAALADRRCRALGLLAAALELGVSGARAFIEPAAGWTKVDIETAL